MNANNFHQHHIARTRRSSDHDDDHDSDSQDKRPLRPGKLADAEIHFTGGELDGLKLVGFAVWQRRDGNGQNVSFPSRQFTVQGERRSFSLLRWIAKRNAQERLESLFIQAYEDRMRELSRTEPH